MLALSRKIDTQEVSPNYHIGSPEFTSWRSTPDLQTRLSHTRLNSRNANGTGTRLSGRIGKAGAENRTEPIPAGKYYNAVAYISVTYFRGTALTLPSKRERDNVNLKKNTER